MNRTLTYQISCSDAGLRAEQFLRRRGFSAKLLTRLRQSLQYLSVNGQPSRLNTVLKEADMLIVTLPEEESSRKIPPVYLPISILYEDEDLIVVNKPAGMPIHPSMNHYENSLANGLAWYYQSQGETFVFRCTNRLDRDTSGVTIVAKNVLCSSILSEMGARHTIHREYLAVVRGRVYPPYGTVDAPLARVNGSLIERAVDYEHGEPAITHYQLLKWFPDRPQPDTDTPVKTESNDKNGYSLVSLVLETGRTHQIRVHMRHIGYPLLGDYLYHPDMTRISRQALHSWHMTLLHPITGKLLTFTAPLPDDLQRLVSPPDSYIPE